MYPTSGSTLNPSISAGLSTSIIVKVGQTTVGAIQSLTIDQSRDMNVFSEIGTDGVVEICPKGNTMIDVQIERLVFDQLRITEAFGRGFANIQAQRYPFDIQIIDTSVSSAEGDAVVTTLHGCWFNKNNVVYNTSSFLITERASVKCEYATTTRQGVSSVFGGIRGISFDYDTVERATDTAGRRGRLDSAGFTNKG